MNSLTKLLKYLTEEWNEDVANGFLTKLDRRFQTLSTQPYIGVPSEKVSGVRGILVTHHNNIFYKVSDKLIIIISMKDTRSNPSKNPYK